MFRSDVCQMDAGLVPFSLEHGTLWMRGRDLLCREGFGVIGCKKPPVCLSSKSKS